MAEQFNAKPAEIKLLFRGQLDPTRSRELQEQMRFGRAAALSGLKTQEKWKYL
ncbi:hypothetical protein VB735_32545 [Halotia wernerae UHCC 0503]|nr:hypothetical protein [Halotia wernerae UHCC 0503]